MAKVSKQTDGRSLHGGEVCHVAARAALDRILTSSRFLVSTRNRAFLKFVVEEALAERGSRIKAYTIAVEVFGRPGDFDPQNDPVVRIEAGRLRRAIELYYLSAGRDDPMRIDIPKGSYIPEFLDRAWIEPGVSAQPTVGDGMVRPPPASAVRRWPRMALLVSVLVGAPCLFAAGYIVSDQQRAGFFDVTPARPSIVVLPFSDLAEGGDQTLLSRAFAEEVLTQLTRYKTIIVYDQKAENGLDRAGDRLREDTESGVAYTLDGSVARDVDELRVVVRLKDKSSREIVWAQSFHRTLKTGPLYALQEEIAADVATEIARPYGLMARINDLPTASLLPEDVAADRKHLRP